MIQACAALRYDPGHEIYCGIADHLCQLPASPENIHVSKQPCLKGQTATPDQIGRRLRMLLSCAELVAATGRQALAALPRESE